ncbi:MAG TPA: NUDIX domain-containing protein [Candidatus Saccharimonadales bacterium]|nr:NUDIX domain-containing protein [Candidatus Saccharimonadales bacterium]
MPDLPIQIVDENNNPTGSATKQEAWKHGLIHRVVRISILDPAGRLLVQKRSLQKGLFPGRWDNSAAGHVDAGETYEQAALRELHEELGLKDIELQKLGDYYVDVTDDWRRMKRFTRSYKIVLQDPLPLFQLPENEVETTEWMDVAKVKKLIVDHPEQVTDGLEQIINRFF